MAKRIFEDFQYNVSAEDMTMFSDILSSDEEFSDLFNGNSSNSFDEWDLESILADDSTGGGLFSDEDLFGNGRSDDVDSNTVVSGKNNN